MMYDENTQFSENNIASYLGELEEYFATLLTYLATQRGDPNPKTSSIAYDNLNTKDFNKAQISIDYNVEPEITKDQTESSS